LILDEIEKSGGSDQGGRVQDALLTMLEPTSAQRFYDECLNVEIDLSWINWIATANDLDRLPAALRSRFSVIEAPAPDGRYLEPILLQLASDTAADLQLRRSALPALDTATVDALRADLDRFGDVRRIARAYRRAVAAAVRGSARPVDA
jgi:ATP-dependent Lon protease